MSIRAGLKHLLEMSLQFNNDQLWEDIVEEFQIPLACTNGTQALKYIYFRLVNMAVPSC